VTREPERPLKLLRMSRQYFGKAPDALLVRRLILLTATARHPVLILGPSGPERRLSHERYQAATRAVSIWSPSNSGITTRTGDSGDATPVFSLTIDPNHPDTVWTGTQGVGGIFKSTDGGLSWDRKDNGVTEAGIFISTDSGQNWQLAGPAKTTRFPA
jgi:hypothetical protein